MNPGSSVWSAALSKRLKPRSHILLEPEVKYKPIMDEFTASHPGSYWLPLDGYDWNVYPQIFASNPLRPEWALDQKFPLLDPLTVPPEDGINTDIIFTGNLSMAGSDGERLLAQFLTCCALGQWVQKFGRVRFLVWVQDALRDRYLPRGIGGRNRAAVVAETVAEVHEVVSSATLRSGKGYPRPIDLDAEGKLTVPKVKRFKSPIGINKRVEDGERAYVRAIRPMTIEELEVAITNMEELRGKNKGRGKKRDKGAPIEPRHTKLYSLDLERLRRRLLHVVELNPDPEVEALFNKLLESDKSISRRTTMLLKAVEFFLHDPKGGQRWLMGMKHPPWWYRQDKRRVVALAAELARGVNRPVLTNRSHIHPINIETARKIEVLQGEEPPVDPATQRQREEAFDQFQECWAKPHESIVTIHGVEDEALSFQRGMLMWLQRKFDPVVSTDSDFHPSLPLTLLDFAPIEMGEFFRPEDPHLRVSNWEVYMWVLRSLFMLRARSLNAALTSMAPGGENLLKLVDQNMGIDGNMRVRMLEVHQAVELTRAWRDWPFQSLGEHLEPPTSVTSFMAGVIGFTEERRERR